MENNTNSNEDFFQLLDQFLKMSKHGFDNQENTITQWTQFKTLIRKRPIDYTQIFDFLCTMQNIDTDSSRSAAGLEQPSNEIGTQSPQNGYSQRSDLGIQGGVNTAVASNVNGRNIEQFQVSPPRHEVIQLNQNNQEQVEDMFSGGIQMLNNQKELHADYKKNKQQGNEHHNRDICQEPTDGSEDKNRYFSKKSFKDFLSQFSTIRLGRNKARFADTSVLQLHVEQYCILRPIAISFFVNILSELPHPESPPEKSCASSRAFLIEIFLKVYNQRLGLSLNRFQPINSIKQLHYSLKKNLGQLLELYFIHRQSPRQLVRTFLHQLQSSHTFLVGLSALMKNLVIQFVKESDYGTIARILNKEPIQQRQQEQQQLDVSIASTCASFSSLDDQRRYEKQRRQNLRKKLHMSDWISVKHEWLYLLSLALRRPIELSQLRDIKLDQILFMPKKMTISPVVLNNRIDILHLPSSVFTNRTYHQSLSTHYLFVTGGSELDVSTTQESLESIQKLVDLQQLNGKVNFKDLLKHLNDKPTSQQPASDSTLSILLNQVSPQQDQVNEQPMQDEDIFMGHSSSIELESDLNSAQDSNELLQQQEHNSSADDELDLRSSSDQNPQQLEISPQEVSLEEAVARLQQEKTNNSPHTQMDLISANPADDSNRLSLYGKIKDMLLELNINTDQLNHLANFPLLSSTAVNDSNGLNIIDLHSKEDIHPKCPLKQQSVLYPIKKQPSNSSNCNPTSTLASFPFNLSPPVPASKNSGYSSPFGISLNSPSVSKSRNKVIPGNKFGIPHPKSDPRQQQRHTNSNLNTNHIDFKTPAPSLGQNNQQRNSSLKSNKNSFLTAASNSKPTPHSFFGVGNFAFSSLGSKNILTNGADSLSVAGTFKRHNPNINQHKMNWNIGKTNEIQRDILNKVFSNQTKSKHSVLTDKK